MLQLLLLFLLINDVEGGRLLLQSQSSLPVHIDASRHTRCHDSIISLFQGYLLLVRRHGRKTSLLGAGFACAVSSLGILILVYYCKFEDIILAWRSAICAFSIRLVAVSRTANLRSSNVGLILETLALL